MMDDDTVNVLNKAKRGSRRHTTSLTKQWEFLHDWCNWLESFVIKTHLGTEV